MSKRMLSLFEETYRQLLPGAAMPAFSIQFFPYANVNSTVRLRGGNLHIRVSDLLEGAPQSVLRALAHILLTKIFRKPVDRSHMARYRKYLHSMEIRRKAHLMCQLRGRKHLISARGQVYDLAELFEELNQSFFGGLLAQPRLSWSRNHSHNRLGHYDPAHNVIVVSRIFDQPSVPRYAVEYLLYHEMLHLKYPVKVRGTRRSVHTAEFLAEEQQFPRLEAARRFLKRLAPAPL